MTRSDLRLLNRSSASTQAARCLILGLFLEVVGFDVLTADDFEDGYAYAVFEGLLDRVLSDARTSSSEGN